MGGDRSITSCGPPWKVRTRIERTVKVRRGVEAHVTFHEKTDVLANDGPSCAHDENRRPQADQDQSKFELHQDQEPRTPAVFGFGGLKPTLSANRRLRNTSDDSNKIITLQWIKKGTDDRESIFQQTSCIMIFILVEQRCPVIRGAVFPRCGGFGSLLVHVPCWLTRPQ